MDHPSLADFFLTKTYCHLSVPSQHINLPENINRADLTVSNAAFERVLERVRCYAKRRVVWLRKVWTEAGNQQGASHSVHLEIDGYLNNNDLPAIEDRWYKTDKSIQKLNAAIRDIDHMVKADTHSRLAKLIQIFSLNDAERDLLHVCFASALEPGINRVFAYLHDHSGRGYVSETLVARLFGHGYCLAIGPESPLKKWELVVEQEVGRADPSRFELAPFIRNWLLGMPVMDESLSGIAGIQPVLPALPGWPVKEAADWIKKTRKDATWRCVRLFVAGEEGSGKRTFAACVAERLGLSLLAVNSDAIPDERWLTVFTHVQRQAFLDGCAVVWYGEQVKNQRWPHHIPFFGIQFVTGEADEQAQPVEGILDRHIDLLPLQSTQRRELWLDLVPSAATWQAEDLDALVRRRQTNIGQISAAARRKVSNIAEATEAISTGTKRRLGTLAQHLHSDFQKEDLILPETLRRALHDFTFEANERTLLWEQKEAKRLFPQGKGLLALFTGAPGTGKTMAAQVIANELRLDLYRVDLSTIVSKYVGETSKNIERILTRAQRMDVILFFDEADALFGARTAIKDAHDRFANTDTNYLLQAIEQYPGIAILASNRKSNIDNGFIRRLRYVLEFPKPDIQQRSQLWQQIIQELAGAERAKALSREILQLAGMQEITGAQIKYAVLTALYLARQEQTKIGMAHLLRGLERELAKEGRALSRHDYELLKNQT